MRFGAKATPQHNTTGKSELFIRFALTIKDNLLIAYRVYVYFGLLYVIEGESVLRIDGWFGLLLGRSSLDPRHGT